MEESSQGMIGTSTLKVQAHFGEMHIMVSTREVEETPLLFSPFFWPYSLIFYISLFH